MQLRNFQVQLPCMVWIGVLGSLLVDIGLKLHLVHFAVKFSLASAALWLRRTWLQSGPCAASTQVNLSQFSGQPCPAALNSAELKIYLGELEPESVKSPSLCKATWPTEITFILFITFLVWTFFMVHTYFLKINQNAFIYFPPPPWKRKLMTLQLIFVLLPH